MHPLRLLGAEAEGQHRAIDLGQRVADRLAGLERDQPAELLAPRLDPGADVAQDRAALVGGQVAGDLEGRDRGVDRLLVLLGRRVERRAGRLAGARGVLDDERVGRLDPATGEEDRMRLRTGRRRHGRGSCGGLVRGDEF